MFETPFRALGYDSPYKKVNKIHIEVCPKTVIPLRRLYLLYINFVYLACKKHVFVDIKVVDIFIFYLPFNLYNLGFVVCRIYVRFLSFHNYYTIYSL